MSAILGCLFILQMDYSNVFAPLPLITANSNHMVFPCMKLVSSHTYMLFQFFFFIEAAFKILRLSVINTLYLPHHIIKSLVKRFLPGYEIQPNIYFC